jgi:hypothetical protein
MFTGDLSELLTPDLEMLEGDHKVSAVYAAVAVAGAVKRTIHALKHAHGVSIARGHHRG